MLKRVIKKYWKLYLIIAIISFMFGLCGCMGSPGGGGMGGQGISIHAEYGSHIEHVQIIIDDGGTDAALRYKSDGHSPATTQPGF